MNKLMHSIHGNKTVKKTLRIDSWNCGHGALHNKMNEIKVLIRQRNPHLLILQEANLFSWNEGKDIKIDKYKLYTSKMKDDPSRKCSRVVVYVKENVKVKQIKSLEIEDFSCIWLGPNLPHMKKDSPRRSLQKTQSPQDR